MGSVVLDTSLVIAVFDKADARHKAAVAALLTQHESGRDFALPASVVAEALVGEARRAGEAGVAERRLAMRELFGPARPIDEEVAVGAAHLRAKHPSLRLPDALVIATGVADDADLILTADKRWAPIDERVLVLGE